MLFSIGSTLVMAGVAGYSYLKLRGPATSDAEKIQRIFANSGLTVKEAGILKTIHLQRKSPFKGGVEYVYQLPLGLSSKQVIHHKHVLEDGLNVRHKMYEFELSDLMSIKWDRTILKQIQNIFNNKKVKQKEIEIDFDGMLKIRVYHEPLTSDLPFSKEMIKDGWLVPIGWARNEFVYHDFDSNYFMIVAGAAGFGKSQFLKLLITVLAIQEPDNVKFHLIDLKGGLSFSRFKDMKQVESFGKDPEGAYKILKKVQEIMEKRHEYLEANGFEDVKEAGIPDRHFIIIDEAADLTDKCQDIVEDIARRGRACGLRMVYATQYPTNETLRSQVRQNALARVCFKLKTNIASRAVLDEGGAEELPEIPGRAIYQTVSNKIVQTPYMKNSKIKEYIQPYITIKTKEDDDGQKSSQTATDRKYTFEFKKI